jgi:hypothetical protein
MAFVLTAAAGWMWAVRSGSDAASGSQTGSQPHGVSMSSARPPHATALGSVLGGYPPPATPTVTPEPGPEGVFPPPNLTYRMVQRGGSPYAALIAALETAFAGRAGASFGPWVDGAGAGLAMEYPGATEGFGIHLTPFSAANLLDGLFAAGSDPVVQGYFEQPGCDGLGSGSPCWPTFVTTGWQGPVPMPTKHPSETLGPPTPPNVPVGAAAWEMVPEAGGPYWVGWWLGDGYHSLLERLVTEGHGPYFVLR